MRARSSTPFLSLHGVSLRVGERLLFTGTTWTFRRGQQWALVGPNGAGKSCLAAALCGHVPVVRGDVQYHFRMPPGVEPEHAVGTVSFAEQRAAVGNGFVQARWNTWALEGAARVSDYLSRDHVEDRNPFEIRVDPPGAAAAFARRRRHAIAATQIASLQRRALITLSNGEMRKVVLARALCRPLRLLILDDPFAGLDGLYRRHLRDVLTSIMRGPLRVLLITPRLSDLPRGITHMLVAERGRVVAQGAAGVVRRLAVVRRLLAPHAVAAAGRLPIPVPASPPRPAGRDVICLREVTVRYGRTTILDRVNWTVRAGESWALLGPNGAGKTTVLSLIVGDNPQAYANDVSVFGRRRGTGESIWEIKRRIGWISPEVHLNCDGARCCLDTVLDGFSSADGARPPGTRRQRLQARQWLKAFGLLAHAGQPLGTLSTGLQRMVLLARALVAGPDLLVLDEPCQGLDAAHRRRFVQTVDAILQRTATTVIYVTHRRDELPARLQHVLRLSGGRGGSSSGGRRRG
ncbi:MAG: ATP-binding cassette domain-containing protein [Lentisphaerae bacterium]|nr:ATP-binding cassette domain-containing protein [Lentisphaerota bacterium]